MQALRPTLPILIGASLMLTLSMGLRSSRFGIFMQPLTHDIGFRCRDFTLALAGAETLAWGFLFLQPVAGAMTVRYGFRPIAVIGSLMYIAGLALMATAHGMVSDHDRRRRADRHLAGLHRERGDCDVGRGGARCPRAVRSTVLGMVSAAGSLGALLSAPIGQMLNEGFLAGASASPGFVVLSLVPMLPAAWFAGRRRQSSAAAQGRRLGRHRRHLGCNVAAKVAFGNASFVVMTCAYFVCVHAASSLLHHASAVLSADLRPRSDAERAGRSA